MFGEIVEVTEPYPHPEVLYESWHSLLTENQAIRFNRYRSVLKTRGENALSMGEFEGIRAMLKENRAWEKKHGIVYVKPFNNGIIPEALTGRVTNKDEAEKFSKLFSKFQSQAAADKRMQIQKMVEQQRFRVYRQLEWAEPAQKLAWRLYAAGGGAGPVAKTGKRPRSEDEQPGPSVSVDLTQEPDEQPVPSVSVDLTQEPDEQPGPSIFVDLSQDDD